MNLGTLRSNRLLSCAITTWLIGCVAPPNCDASEDRLGTTDNRQKSVYVKRLPWRVELAAIDPISGNVMLIHQTADEVLVANASVFDAGAAVNATSIATADQPHDLAFHQTGKKGKFVVRTKNGELFWVDATSLAKSQSIQLGDVSKSNPGLLCVGSASSLVYTTQSAGLNDPSIPSALVAVSIESDPPTKIDVRGSSRVGTKSPFAISGDENAAIALIDEDHAEYFTLARGTLGKPDENYLRLTSIGREFRVPTDSLDLDNLRKPILFGSPKSGFAIGRNVWAAGAKKRIGELSFQPTVAFREQPWVGGIANLSVRIASLDSAATIAEATLPNEILRGLPHDNTIDEIGLPYAPIKAIILPDVERSRLLVIVGDHVAIVPFSLMGLPQSNHVKVLAPKSYHDELDIERFAVSPDGSRILTLSGDSTSSLPQTITVYDRNTTKATASISLPRRVVSIAMDNEAVYLVDSTGIVTKLDPENLQPSSELGFRCETIDIIDDRFILVDEKKIFDKSSGKFVLPEEPVTPIDVKFPNQKLQNGWLLNGAYYVDSDENDSIGKVGLLFHAKNFVSTPAPNLPFDFWNNAFEQSSTNPSVMKKTREAGTLLCTPLRCSTLPIQLSLVQTEVTNGSANNPEGQNRSTQTKTPSLAGSIATDVQLTLEARNLIDGGLIKKYPLVRERLDPIHVRVQMSVDSDTVFVLHHGLLIEVDLDELREETFPRGPTIDANAGPVSLARQRFVKLRYRVKHGQPPYQVTAVAAAMKDQTNAQALKSLATDADDSIADCEFDLETWLRQNLADIAEKFDEHFVLSPEFDAEGEIVENLRTFMVRRSDQTRSILGRDPVGIPVMIGIRVRVTDSAKNTSEQEHFVTLEIPANALILQIEKARSRRMERVN